jgi:DNA modification methylase
MIASETIAEGITLHPGDCLDVLKAMADASVDSCVTDPPYHLTSIVKRFSNAKADTEEYATKKSNTAYMSRGFMGKQWDGGDIAFRTELWAEVLRVLKPGGHLLAFSGTRTYHRMTCAIEDAGFEIRDQIGWAYGSGFPKSHDVSKGIDKAAGAERTVRTGVKPGHENFVGRDNLKSLRESGTLAGEGGYSRPWMFDADKVEAAHHTFAPATDAAAEWQGWGTALKPAWEPIVLARKPLEGTVAANVLEHGTGAINIDGCRVATDESTERHSFEIKTSKGTQGGAFGNAERVIHKSEIPIPSGGSPLGRWPANLVHDGSEEVVGAFPETAPSNVGDRAGGCKFFMGGDSRDSAVSGFGDSGSAARFFYTAKADADDRLGSKHPTVKPLDLMQWLVRLVTPPGGLVLDPFAGTGTTGEAAFREGFRAVLIEREAEYQADIRRRMSLVLGGPDERRRESIKASGKTEDAGPLFSGL